MQNAQHHDGAWHDDVNSNPFRKKGNQMLAVLTIGQRSTR